ncbi:MBL fold metallo-hydrolase [Arthrobacter yangruifuii]|uniref:MBL fold metallo-hydrolase n=1 Tax=Arthrobacter yangruifuii TaxID=2606616 RepID=A0A5N6MHZ5_9MICC|nr:MBL fold metallo-hydrolase [Arthrobacter yangruifuii]
MRSFVLERQEGNLIIYNSPGVTGSGEAIGELGGAAGLLINHEHEAMYGPPEIDVDTYVHQLDRAAVESSLPVAGVFTGHQMIGRDLEVIPTPGHTAGTTSYLWDNGDRRFLFTGDFIWIDHGEWKAVVLEEHLRGDYLDSLALVRDLDFDVLVPWGTTEDGPSYGLVRTPGEIRDRIDAIIRRVHGGGSR